MKYTRWRIICIVLGGLLLVSVAGVILGSADDYIEIDVNTGKTRHRAYLLHLIPLETKIIQTPFSDMVEDLSLGRGPAEWRLVSSKHRTVFSTTRREYRYGHTVGPCYELSVALLTRDGSLEEKKVVVARALELLSGGDIEGLEDFARGVEAGSER